MMEALMTTISILSAAPLDAYQALLASLEAQFGVRESVAIATHFLNAEQAEFHWESRVAERWLGRYESLDDADLEFDRVAFMGRLQGVWFAATGIVDGNGAVNALQHLRLMGDESQARSAFDTLR